MSDINAQADQLAANFLAKGNQIHSFLEQGIEACTLLVLSDAQHRTPVDSGLLRASESKRVENHGGKITGIVGTNVEYAPFQEFGTSKMPAQPFLTPALNGNKEAIKAILGAAVKRGTDAR
jgi:HK97 gp10 family phage protein